MRIKKILRNYPSNGFFEIFQGIRISKIQNQCEIPVSARTVGPEVEIGRFQVIDNDINRVDIKS